MTWHSSQQTALEQYVDRRAIWLASQVGLHIGSWMAVDGVGPSKVELSMLMPDHGSLGLYFVTMGSDDA
ncbi:hypothetical protein D3M70_16540 [Pseudomonas sp. LS-2]|nr:hypothetical protein D3M70_16540 [Pseudomonas sp. LS-2]